MARPAGLEPATFGLEIRCSIQLSYGRSIPRRPPVESGEVWSGRWDLNPRLGAPKAPPLPAEVLPEGSAEPSAAVARARVRDPRAVRIALAVCSTGFRG